MDECPALLLVMYLHMQSALCKVVPSWGPGVDVVWFTKTSPVS